MSKRRELCRGDSISKSEIFLFPMLKSILYHINDKVDYLINVGFVQVGFPQIVLTFDNIDYEPLKEDLYRLSNLSEFTDKEYDDDDKEVSLFFDVPRIFKKDFELFVQGKYSEFSPEYKKLLVQYYGSKRGKGRNTETGLPIVSMYDAIYPTDELKQTMANELGIDVKLIKEVLDKPNIEKEEFKSVEELEAYGIKQ